MSKQKINQRLDNLFTQIDTTLNANHGNEPPSEKALWRTDHQGNYSEVSAKAAEICGIPLTLWEGQPFKSFCLNDTSTLKLNALLEKREFPAQVRVIFNLPGSQPVPVEIHITEESEGALSGEFFSIAADAIAPTVRSTPATDKTSTRKFPERSKTGALIGGYPDQSEDDLELSKATSMLRVPVQIPSSGRAYLEFMDDRPDRRWRTEEKLLAEEVSRQLSIALENAQLYESLQVELNERIRAEENVKRRNQDLAVLNEIGQRLSRLTEEVGIFSILRETLSRLVDTQNLIVALINPEENVLTFPIYTRNAVSEHYPDQPQRNDILNYICKSRQTLLLSKDVNKTLEQMGILAMEPEPYSVVGVPLVSAGKALGLFLLQIFQKDHMIQDEQVDLLETVASHTAIALENSRSYLLTQRAYEEIREVDRLKSQFLANMSHELRTPLNSIIGFSRVILKGIDGPINDIQEQDLSSIYNSGQHLLGLINNVLDLSKIEAGKMELQLEEIRLEDMIRAVVSTGIGLVKDKPVQIKYEIQDNLPTVLADETRIRQVMLNLLSNAAKFTEKGSIVIKAGVKKSIENRNEIMVTFTDTGPGIEEKDQSRLFQPFSQVDDSPTRKTGGTGLGLSICKSFIEMHKGRIGVLHSEIGKGTTFFFTLPVQTAEPEPEISQPAQPEPTGITILSIDDDEQVISLYQRFLQPHGFNVIGQTKAKNAVARAKELQPSAITLDIMMPEMDGWQVLLALKKDPETHNIPVIICSIMEDTEKGLNLGAADYLVKPFLPDELAASIKNIHSNPNPAILLAVSANTKDQENIRQAVNRAGKFEIYVTDNQQEAIQIIAEKAIDLILIDFDEEHPAGFDLAEIIQNDPATVSIPVIMLTSEGLNEEQTEKLALFSQARIAKSSLGEADFLEKLEALLTVKHESQTKE